MRNRTVRSEGEPETSGADCSLCSRFCRVASEHKKLSLCVLAIFLVLPILLGRAAIILPTLYKRNLQSHPFLMEMIHPTAGEKILILAPHPDDETLACGGLIQQAVQSGSSVRVVLMTNGEYPEIDMVLLEETVRFSKDSFVRLGEMRQKESLRALDSFGLSAQHVICLGYPNRYLTSMWLPSHWQPTHPVRSVRTRSTRSPFANSMTRNAVYCGESMLGDLEAVLLRERPDVVFAPHPNDMHPDHWPTYAAARFALNELSARGQSFAKTCRVYTYLIHRDSWPTPRAYRPKMALDPPVALTMDGQTDWVALPLTPEQTALKHKATGMYRTQAGSIDPLLRSFSRGNELFGGVPVQTWPEERIVPGRVVIVDPDADLLSSASYRSGDISLVSLGRSEGRLVAEIITRGATISKTGYHLSIHAGGSDPSGRVIAQYDWQGDKASGLLFSKGRFRGTGDMHTKSGGNISRLDAPWPLETGKQSFFLLRAWTTKGKHLTDQTATATYRISNENR